MQAQLNEVGIRTEIQTVEFGALLKVGEQGDFDAMSLGWSGRIDPDGNIEPIFHSNGAFNYRKYTSSAIGDAISRERQTTDQSARKQIFQEIQKTIREDAAYSFTYFPPTFVTVLGFNFLGDAIRDALDPRLRS